MKKTILIYIFSIVILSLFAVFFLKNVNDITFLANLNFWSAVLGLGGTILIFFFGLPERVNKKGHINLILEQVDECEIKKYKRYSILNYSGLFFLALSFLIQIIHIFI